MEILERNEQHPETLPFFLAQVLMVHLVRASYCTEVEIVRVPQPFGALMDEYIVDEKIGCTIQRDPSGDPNAHIRNSRLGTEKEEGDRGHGEDQEEGIVPLEDAAMILLVVITMQHPQQAVHDEPMGEPRHELHERERQEQGHDIDRPSHPVAKIVLNTASR